MSTSLPQRLRRRRVPRQQQHELPGSANHINVAWKPDIDRTANGQSKLFDTVLNKVYEDTPPRLRELEQGWKIRRRRAVSDAAGGDVVESGGTEDEVAGRTRLQDGQRNGQESFSATRSTSLPSPPCHSHIVMDHPPPEPAANRKRPSPAVRFDVSFPSALPTPPSTPPSPAKTLDGEASISISPPIVIPPPQRHSPRSTSRLGTGISPPHIREIPLLPPTSPSPPPARTRSISLPAVKVSSPRINRHTQSGSARRILAHPLPPTPHAIPLIAKGRDKIYVSRPGARFELELRLRNGRVLRVSEGGEEMVFMSSSEVNGPSKMLRISEYNAWSANERKEWDMVYKLVEEFKRRTPRVKYFDPLGHLTVTCSSPPDIILSFHLDTPSPQSRDKATSARIERKPSESRAIKVRLLFSRSKGELRIDTSFVAPGNIERPRERFRTKRVAPLGAVSRSPTQLATGSSSEAIEMALGLGRESSAKWAEEEKEGLRRLWALRGCWNLA